jgi:hypothetical protein
MRCAERALEHQSAARQPQSGGRVQARHVERLRHVERGQDAGEPAREHRFAGAGWPDQQHVVGARGGDLERAARHRLAAHVG